MIVLEFKLKGKPQQYRAIDDMVREHVTFVADTLKGAATRTKAAFAAWVYICSH